uniref:Uncharacterized protein n=1 Tax=Trichuris muris TaxID=70415 RepID=A0A5S6QHQ6_TRIMR
MANCAGANFAKLDRQRCVATQKRCSIETYPFLVVDVSFELPARRLSGSHGDDLRQAGRRQIRKDAVKEAAPNGPSLSPRARGDVPALRGRGSAYELLREVLVISKRR